MKGLRDRLSAADPLAADPGLSEAECAELRRRLTLEASAERAVPPDWREGVAILAAVLLLVAIGVTTGRRQAASGVAQAALDAALSGEPRQLQFATPGGTRVIWTFDPAFSVKETNP